MMEVRFILRGVMLKTLYMNSPCFREGMGIRYGHSVHNVHYTVFDLNDNYLEVHLSPCQF